MEMYAKKDNTSLFITLLCKTLILRPETWEWPLNWIWVMLFYMVDVRFCTISCHYTECVFTNFNYPASWDCLQTSAMTVVEKTWIRHYKITIYANARCRIPCSNAEKNAACICIALWVAFWRILERNDVWNRTCIARRICIQVLA